MRVFSTTYLWAAVTVGLLTHMHHQTLPKPPDGPAWQYVLVGAAWPLVGFAFAATALDLVESKGDK